MIYRYLYDFYDYDIYDLQLNILTIFKNTEDNKYL